MPVEWKDESVIDHSGGITDLVTASGSEFQELCNNLGHNVKLKMLSSREGYRRYTTAVTASPISQLFKLEDWIIAFCEDGNLYYRQESDTVSPWLQVETPKSRAATLFRIHTSAGKGFTLRTEAPSTIYDQFVVKGENLGAGVTAPSLSASGRTITLTVNTHSAYFNRTTLKFNGGSGNYTYASLAALFAAPGWTFTRLSGTLTTDDVVFDELLALQESASPYLGVYPASARSDGDSTALGFAGEDGHLQPSEWQSHLFLALEPYLKTFTANPSDPYGEDPETFPPTDQRIPLRKVVPFAKAIGASSDATVLKALSAQLPKVYLGIDETESPENTYADQYAHYRYQVFTIKWNYSPAYNADDYASVEVWCERTWGYQGPSGTMGTHVPYLEHRTLAYANPIDAAMPFSLCDVAIKSAGDYGSILPTAFPVNSMGSPWGFLCLVYHNPTTATPTRTFQDVVDGLESAFEEYQRRNVKIGASYYKASYGQFGYYIKVNPRSKMNAFVNVESPGHTISVRYADRLPDDVPGNHTYGYALYLRDRYKAMVEGSPREFQVDGPAAFLSVRTLSPVTAELRRGYDKVPPTVGYQTFTYSAGPRVFGGISAAINRSSSLYYQSGLEAVFARTLSGGDTFYVEEAKKFWYRTGETPTLIGGTNIVPSSILSTDNWTTKTAYIAIHESETTDDLIQFEEEAYFNGGVVSNDALPRGPYYFTVVNQTGYYAHVTGNIQRVYQSPPGMPYGSPLTLFEDFDDELTGLASFQDKPLVTTQNKLWRIEGVKASDGSGRTFLRSVSDVYGCIANQSIVATNIGLFLWSSSGIIYTDGLRALRVTEHLISRYQTWLSDVRGGEPTIGPEQLRGRFDEIERKIYWSLTDADGKPFFVVLSLSKGISDSMPVVTEDGCRFKTVDVTDGEVTPVDYFETHATLYSKARQAWYRAQGGYLMVRDSGRTYDESHVTGLKHPILPLYKSVAFAYGIPWARKHTSKIQLNLRDITKTGVSLTPLGWNDLSEVPHRLGNCLSYQHMAFSLDYATATPLDLQQFFRHTDCRWKSEMVVTYKRHFGRGRQRNCFKQVGFQGLQLKYAQIGKETAGINNITVTTKASDGIDFLQETVFIDITAAGNNTVIDLLLDASGQFYVTWNDSMDPAPISNVTLSTTTNRIIVLPGGSTHTGPSDHVEAWPEITFYRVFTDQKIDLLGYNVTYRLVGDRTHGSLKSAENGGVDA